MAFLIDLSQASGDKTSVDCTDIVPWDLAMAKKAHRFDVETLDCEGSLLIAAARPLREVCNRNCRGMRIYRRL